MSKDETAKWLQAFGDGCGTGEPAVNRVDADYTPEYLNRLEAELKLLSPTMRRHRIVSLSTAELTGLVQRYIGRGVDVAVDEAMADVNNKFIK